jgi:hypothetical protein
MAGSIKWVIYTGNIVVDAQGNGTFPKYSVRMDESNSEISGLGFSDFTGLETDVIGTLPRGMKMRYISTINVASGATRKLYVGSPGIYGALAGASLLLGLFGAAGTAALVAFGVRGFVDEERVIAFAPDTGLNDGDAT